MSEVVRQDTTEAEGSRKVIFIAVGIITAVLLAGMLYIASRPSTRTAAPRLEGAFRAGSPEFEQYRERIALDAPEAVESPRAVGDIVMVLETTVRNFTGRTINGLEINAAVVDLQGQPVKERTVVVIPTQQQPELEPNKTLAVPVRIEGFRQSDNRANIKMEVTGFKLK